MSKISKFNEFIDNDELLIKQLIKEAEHTNSPNTEVITNREPYRKVVLMGKKVIPYLIERKKYIWNIALKELTGSEPGSTLTRSSDIVEYWQKWGSENGY